MDENNGSRTVPTYIKIIFAGGAVVGGYYLYQYFYNKPNANPHLSVIQMAIQQDNNKKMLAFFPQTDLPNSFHANSSQPSDENKNSSLSTKLSTPQDNNTDKIVDQPNVPQANVLQLSNENKNSSLNTQLSTQNNNTEKIIDQPNIPQADTSKISNKKTPKKNKIESESLKYYLNLAEKMHLDY
jgi:hypothetical protein